MARPRTWIIAGSSVAVAALLALVVAWNADPHLFEKRSPPVVLLGITRDITYTGDALGNVTVVPSAGCPFCPLTIGAGTSVVVDLGWWWDNLTSGPGPTAFLNWTLVSPYPFEALAYTPPTPPLVYSWAENDHVGPLGGGGFGADITIVIPYQYSGLPASGEITFTMQATQFGQSR